MAKEKIQKTNAMRLLDSAGINYSMASYEYDESDLSGVHAAQELGVSEDIVFKTLVTRGDGNAIFVFVIPVAESLDLKKAARASGNKSIEMIHVREILDITGYIRGGCSPIGMKKAYPTFIDETAILSEKIYFSAGKRGVQISKQCRVLRSYEIDCRFILKPFDSKAFRILRRAFFIAEKYFRTFVRKSIDIKRTNVYNSNMPNKSSFLLLTDENGERYEREYKTSL